MTNKLERAAMQQALKAMKDASPYGLTFKEAIIACEEALDHSGEANEMVVGWDMVKPEAIASDPLYQQGFVDGVEEGRNQVTKQAEQEPDYFGLTHDHTWLSIDKKQYEKLKPEGRMVCYAAPVRTKDLTDDEIETAKHCLPRYLAEITDEDLNEFARAVIAADREKNK